MKINIFVLKGDLDGKIVVVRFFFCRVYVKVLKEKAYIKTRTRHFFLKNKGTKLHKIWILHVCSLKGPNLPKQNRRQLMIHCLLLLLLLLLLLCVCACVRACVCACLRACARACVRVWSLFCYTVLSDCFFFF